MISFHCFKCGTKASFNARKGIICYNCSCWPYRVVQYPSGIGEDTPTSPALKATKPSSSAEERYMITPDEATRLCSLIQEQIGKHCASCEYCKLVLKLQLNIRLCNDALDMQNVLEYWEEYTKIEKDRHAK